MAVLTMYPVTWQVPPSCSFISIYFFYFITFYHNFIFLSHPFYIFLILAPQNANSLERLGLVVDVPPHLASLNTYSATVGHKVAPPKY